MLMHIQCGAIMEVAQDGVRVCPKCGKTIKLRISRK